MPVTLTRTTIEWCYNGSSLGYSWNFITGCTKISEGCKHCYAEAHAKRFWGKRKFTEIEIHLERLSAPLHLSNKPATIFVNSMSDAFHESLSIEIIQSALHIMEATPHLHYIILTKRANLMQTFFAQIARRQDGSSFARNPLQNLTLGVSVENNKQLDRINYLQNTPAAQRIISFEPLLEEVNAASTIRSTEGRIHHAIIGGESGAGARACHLDWISSLLYQCDMLNIGVFVKQLGAKAMARTPGYNSEPRRYFTKSKKGSEPSEWPQILQRRELIHMPLNTTGARAYAQISTE